MTGGVSGRPQNPPMGQWLTAGSHLSSPQERARAGSVLVGGIEPEGAYPPAIAPTMRKGSVPFTTASGNESSGDSLDRSSSQA